MPDINSRDFQRIFEIFRIYFRVSGKNLQIYENSRVFQDLPRFLKNFPRVSRAAGGGGGGFPKSFGPTSVTIQEDFNQKARIYLELSFLFFFSVVVRIVSGEYWRPW